MVVAVAGNNLGCTANTFDFYTTWSFVIFLLSILAYGSLVFSERTRVVFFARCIVWWGIANAFAVGIVGHLAVSYPKNSEVFTKEAHTNIRLIDGFMHLLPLLVWAVIFAADSDRIVRGAGWPTFAFVLMLFVVVVALYGAIPAQIKNLNNKYDEDKDTCKAIRQLQDTTFSDISNAPIESKPRRRGFDKMKLVYFRYQSDSSKVMTMAVAMPVLFVLFVVMFVAMAAHKRYRTQEDRVYGRQKKARVNSASTGRTNVRTSN